MSKKFSHPTKTLKPLKADFHLHTAEDPLDRIRYTAKELISKAADEGFDVLSITNHHRITFSSELFSYAQGRGILLIPGVEVTVHRRHILLLNPPRGKPWSDFSHLSKLRRPETLIVAPHRPGALDPAATRRALSAALDTTAHAESRLRLTFAPPRLFLAIEPLAPLPARLYEEGVACVTVDLRRDNPRAKATRFIATAQAAYGRLPAGVEEGLIVAGDGAVLEGLSSNFSIREGVLRTEEDRALAGVTRSLAIELAQPLMPLRRVAVRRDDLPLLNEAFITSVSREVLPVVRIDERPVGDGRVGPRTHAIMQVPIL